MKWNVYCQRFTSGCRLGVVLWLKLEKSILLLDALNECVESVKSDDDALVSSLRRLRTFYSDFKVKYSPFILPDLIECGDIPPSVYQTIFTK
jgi:hypothetical protein